MVLIKTIRIHQEDNPEDNYYELFDREGNFRKRLNNPIQIFNLKVKRFGFCNWDSIDVTLELEEPIDSSQIEKTPT